LKKSAKNNPSPAAIPVDWTELNGLLEARDCGDLVQCLAGILARRLKVRSFRLVYRTEGVFERVTVSRGKLKHEPLNAFAFGDSARGFFNRRLGPRLLLGENDDYVQIHLELGVPADTPVDDACVELARFAFAQLRLQLRILQLEVNAVRDDLTSAFNQNHLKKCINDEIARFQRHPIPFAILFIDLDGLKEINDRYCHLTGSKVLKEVAGIFIEAVRKTDLVARFGGDEFVVLLQQTELEQAVVVCRRIREKLNSARLCRDEGLDVRITASYGISAMSPRVKTAEDIIQDADQAMFKVKNGGKNAIEIFQGD
jgi:diguanylate cyclase (GGDEF)-like protein